MPSIELTEPLLRRFDGSVWIGYLFLYSLHGSRLDFAMVFAPRAMRYLVRYPFSGDSSSATFLCSNLGIVRVVVKGACADGKRAEGGCCCAIIIIVVTGYRALDLATRLGVCLFVMAAVLFLCLHPFDGQRA
jgi:hypothetical protein